MWESITNLKGKTALVTGGGCGIGESISQVFSRAGAHVLVVDNNRESGTRVANEIGGEFHVLDVVDTGACLALEEDIRRRGTVIDLLVNNAGIGHVGHILSTTSMDLDRLYSVNVRGPFNVCKAFVPAMLERGSGSVINLASVAGVFAVAERLAYTVTKHAVVGLTRALALDHSHSGVRFNAICPGRVETSFIRARLAESPDPERTFREMSSSQLVGRMARPEEIAAAALYLGSDMAAMVTGSCLMIDGGWTAGK